MEKSQISVEVIKNIVTEMFHKHCERQELLSKSHEETMLSIINSNTKIRTKQLDKFHEKIVQNANRIERLEKRNNDFSESLHTCQSIQYDKVEQVKKKIE